MLLHLEFQIGCKTINFYWRSGWWSQFFYSVTLSSHTSSFFFPLFPPALGNFWCLGALFSEDVWSLQPTESMSIPGVLAAAASTCAAVRGGQETWLMCSWWVTDTGVKREWDKLLTHRKGQGHTCPVSSCQIKALIWPCIMVSLNS